MSINSSASGKDRLTKRFEKEREAAVKAATPAPQDDPPAQPPEEPKEPVKADTPTEPKSDTAPKEDPKPALEVDYRQAYRDAQQALAKEKERNKVLEGKYKAEVPRLSKEIKQLKKQLEEGEGTSSIVEKVRQSEDFKRIAEEWDESTAESFLGIAQHMMNSVKPPEKEEEPEPIPEPDPGPSGYDDFLRTMDHEIPGWDLKYNNNPDFVSWASDNIEPMSGRSYLDLLNSAANESFDLKVARNIFSAFDRQVRKPAEPTPESLVEPTSTGGVGKTQPEAPTFKAGAMKDAEVQVRRGKMTRAEFEKLRDDFIKAQREGRVTA